MPRTALPIDDDLLFGAITTDWLRAEGFELVQVRNIREAVSWLAQGTRPEVVILDGLLPDGTGPSFLEKHGELFGGVPVLFTSAFWRDLVSHRMLRKLGVHEIAPKPLNHEQFLRSFRACLPKQAEATRPQLAVA